MTDAPEAKKAKLVPDYELLYWPGIPGRGEYIRLALEAAGIPYLDPANNEEGGVKKIISIIRSTSTSGPEPPALAPPILRLLNHPSGEPLLISQTPNILLYLGDHHTSLSPQDDTKYLVHQYTLTALDLSDEAHNTHHPIEVASYYEDQKPEALRYASQFRKDRIPKFFGFFNRALKYNAEKTGNPVKYLVGETLTYADTTLWQVMDGVTFGFPKRVEELRAGGEMKELFEFYDGLKEEENLKAYLGGPKRLKYSRGIFRYYPELDVE